MPFVQKVMNMMIYMVYIWYSNLYAKRSYFRMKFSYAYIEILPVIEEMNNEDFDEESQSNDHFGCC